MLPASINGCPPSYIGTTNCLATNETPVAFYKAENNAYDANRISNGTFLGTAKYTKDFGERGHAFLLDGTNYVIVAATSCVDIGAGDYGMSVSLWVKATTSGPLIEWGDENHHGFHPDINTLWCKHTVDYYPLTVAQPVDYFNNVWRHVVLHMIS